jgi:hypothetical protein
VGGSIVGGAEVGVVVGGGVGFGAGLGFGAGFGFGFGAAVRGTTVRVWCVGRTTC